MDFWEFRDWRRQRDDRHRRIDAWIEEQQEAGLVRRARQPLMVRRDPLTYFDEDDFFGKKEGRWRVFAGGTVDKGKT